MSHVSLLGDHRLVPRAEQQRIPARLSRCGQGEGEGGDDHLLPHQRSQGQLTTDLLTAEWLPLQRQSGELADEHRSTARKHRGREATCWDGFSLSVCWLHPHGRRSRLKPSCLRLEVAMLVFMSNSTSISSGIIYGNADVFVLFRDAHVQPKHMNTYCTKRKSVYTKTIWYLRKYARTTWRTKMTKEQMFDMNHTFKYSNLK